MDARSTTPAPPSSSSSSGSYFKVFLRLRPSSTQSSISESRFLTTTPDSTHIYVTPPPAPSGFSSKPRPIEKFTFARVFDEATGQLEIFNETVLPLVQDAAMGKDAMLATLGVTGSGKSHTTLGTKDHKGMTQMALEVLFRSLEGRLLDLEKVDLASGDRTDAVVMSTEVFQERMNSALEACSSRRPSVSVNNPRFPDCSDIVVPTDVRSNYAVLISMYELYNDRIFDLLDDTPLSNPAARRKPLLFKKPSSGPQWDTPSGRDSRKVVAGLRKVSCANLLEALTVLEYGQHNRRASPTNSNSVSSRSHAFFVIELKRFSTRHPEMERESSSLQIVDLAGSERARNTQTTGERLVEAGSINRSLMCLGQCLQLQSQSSMSTTSASMIVRQSKLTELLFSNSLVRGGPSSGKAAMIVTADARGDYNATSQILRYSALATEVTVPRRPTIRARSVRSASSCSVSSAHSNGSFTIHPRSMEELSSSSVASSTPVNGKDKIIARLKAQLEETESQWRAAEERCLNIEQSVREEMSIEMEEHIARIMQEAREARWQEEERREGYVDGKLEILMKGLDIEGIYDDDEGDDANILLDGDGGNNNNHHLGLQDDSRKNISKMEKKIEDLEAENDRLRLEIMSLKRELNNRSPTATASTVSLAMPVPGMAPTTVGARKISVKKRTNRIVSGNRTEKGRPLMQIENGRLDDVKVLDQFERLCM